MESAIQHTQATALKGRRFDSIEAQNAWLAHWEERWAALRIHGRKKRQVLEMFREEAPHLRALPMEGFRIFKQVTRTVDDAGLIQVEGVYYAARCPPPCTARSPCASMSAPSRSWTPQVRCCAGTRSPLAKVSS